MPASDKPLPEGTDAVIEGAGAGGAVDEEGLAQEVGAVPADEAMLRDAEAGDLGAASRPNTAGGPAPGRGAGTASSAEDAKPAGEGASWATGGSGAFFDKFAEMRSQGYDQARAYAVQGKERATGAIDELLRTIGDAANQIDDKLGGQYGDYVRRATSGLGDFNEAFKGKDVDELFAEARALVARAPAVAVGTAAALGFVVARLARAGLPETSAPPGTGGEGGTGAKKD